MHKFYDSVAEPNSGLLTQAIKKQSLVIGLNKLQDGGKSQNYECKYDTNIIPPEMVNQILDNSF